MARIQGWGSCGRGFESYHPEIILIIKKHVPTKTHTQKRKKSLWVIQYQHTKSRTRAFWLNFCHIWNYTKTWIFTNHTDNPWQQNNYPRRRTTTSMIILLTYWMNERRWWYSWRHHTQRSTWRDRNENTHHEKTIHYTTSWHIMMLTLLHNQRFFISLSYYTRTRRKNKNKRNKLWQVFRIHCIR